MSNNNNKAHTAAWIEHRKQQVLSSIFNESTGSKYPVSPKTGNNGHKYGYQYGDIRCVNCNKWIRPSDPKHMKEILITAAGRRLHHPRYCPINAIQQSSFSTVPRIRGMNKKTTRLEPKRY